MGSITGLCINNYNEEDMMKKLLSKHEKYLLVVHLFLIIGIAIIRKRQKLST